MFDDLRQQADETAFEPEQTDAFTAFERSVPRRDFLGMTGWQRFVIAIMLLMMTCILSVFCLLATGKIIPTFM
jgi:hypothetical protein